MTPSPSSARPGRPATKFTPSNIQKIKDAVAQGLPRERISQLLEVPLGSLQVTCSRLGISLRHPHASKQWSRVAPAATGASPDPMVRHMQHAEAKFQVVVHIHGEELTRDIPMSIK